MLSSTCAERGSVPLSADSGGKP